MNSTITLYIKTHNVTGLKYFGQTRKTGKQFEKYNGSGFFWKRHLRKYGNDITTEIYAQFDENDPKLEETALKFSLENDIVNSSEWANLMDENAKSGIPHGFLHSDETKKRMSETRIGKPCPKTPALIARMKEDRKGEGNPMFGKTHSDETKEKMRIAASNRTHTDESKAKLSAAAKKIVKCPHCDKEGSAAIMRRWHFTNCKHRKD